MLIAPETVPQLSKAVTVLLVMPVILSTKFLVAGVAVPLVIASDAPVIAVLPALLPPKTVVTAIMVSHYVLAVLVMVTPISGI
jgi:hypothetical protein